MRIRDTRWDRAWLRYVGIAVGYAVAYGFLHIFWFANWQLTAGLRLACLLLVPPRYWPALFVGEAIGLAKFAYDCEGQLGMLWALTVPFVSMSLAMPAVWLFREYRPVVDANKRVIISSLLLCILTVSLLNTGANVLEYALMDERSFLPQQLWSAAHVSYFSYLWFLGAGLGIYMIVPLALWAYTEGDLHLRNIRSRIVRSHVLVETTTYLLISLCLLAYTIEYSHSEKVRHIAQVVMLLAPVWSAMRYGWQGAALSCMLANVAVVLSMPALHDPLTLQTQALMMVSNTGWLLLGARISIVRQRHRRIAVARRFDARRALRHQATHDLLTGLPNRVLFHDRLRAAMRRMAHDAGHRFALALLDLDGFKAVNDQHGHPAGDALLQAVAERLRGNLRANDTVARFGGDEFALILKNANDMATLLHRCERLGAMLAMPYELSGHHGRFTGRISASIGIVLGSGTDEQHLIRVADRALYQAKAAGKNRCVLADTAMESQDQTPENSIDPNLVLPQSLIIL